MFNRAWLSLGFRPLFLSAAASALIMPALWVSYFTGHANYTGDVFSQMNWHAYEMYGGFVFALIAGFLLTASSNWSGIPAISGMPLFILTLLWIFERILLLIPNVSWIFHVTISISGSSLFLVLLYLQLKSNTKNRNIFIPWALLFLSTKFLYLLGGLNHNLTYILLAKKLFLSAIQILIVIITGRIIPFFMEKKVSFRPKKILFIEYLSNISISSILLIDLLPMPKTSAITIYTIAFTSNLFRFINWRPQKTLKEPMLFILLLGYAWLLLHLAVNIVTVFRPQYLQVSTHIFTAGAIGTFAIAMMTRVSLGHTGRPIKADFWILIMFFSITIGAILRVYYPFFKPQEYIQSLHNSSGFWTFAFLIFFIRFSKILVSKRLPK